VGSGDWGTRNSAGFVRKHERIALEERGPVVVQPAMTAEDHAR